MITRRQAIACAACALFGIAAACVSGFAPPVDPASDDTFQSRLKAIDRQIAQTSDLTARFEQHRHTALLRTAIVSSGTVRVSGTRMRWDTTEPGASTMVVDDALLQIYYPDQKLLEIYPIEDRLAQLASSPLPRMSALQEHFAIRRDEAHPELQVPHLAMRLMPQEPELLKHIQQIRLAVDTARGYVLRMEITDADDERTVLQLTEHQINTGITKASLALSLPDDVRRVRPLDGRRNPTSDGAPDAAAPDTPRRSR